MFTLSACLSPLLRPLPGAAGCGDEFAAKSGEEANCDPGIETITVYVEFRRLTHLESCGYATAAELVLDPACLSSRPEFTRSEPGAP